MLKSRRRRWLAVAVLCLVVAALHATILRAAAKLLIVDQTISTRHTVLPLSGDRCYPEAAQRVSSGIAHRVILPQSVPGRLVKMQVLPAHHEIARNTLLSHAVPSGRVVIMTRQACNQWQAARILNEWLHDHPADPVLVLCDRFSSRELDYIYDCEIDSDKRHRVHITALPDRRYDEGNWWRDKMGIKKCFGAAFRLLYARLHGEDISEESALDPEPYENSLFP